jgi:hypothetical protein
VAIVPALRHVLVPPTGLPAARALLAKERKTGMKIKKNVTEKVLAANRQNAAKSTGPKNSENSSRNAIIHAVLCRKLRFEDEEERSLYDKLIEELCADHNPVGASEYAQVFEIAFCTWILRTLDGWLLKEMAVAEGSAQAILKNITESFESEQIPVFAPGCAGTAMRGWECQELLVQTASRTCEEEEGLGTEDVSKKAGEVLVHAKMTRTVGLILRYSAAVKRDYYRALGKLRELQRERYEMEALSAGYMGAGQ